MNELSMVEAVHIATVLEDTVDQLVILGRVMPGTFRQASQVIDEEIRGLVNDQKQIEVDFERRRSSLGGGRAGSPSQQDAVVALRRSTQAFSRVIKQSPVTSDNVEKMQADRAFLERVLYGTMVELMDHGTFQTLSDAVNQEREQKSKLEKAIKAEEEGRKMTRTFQRKLAEIKKLREKEISSRVEMIAHLKDQLQEMKAKTFMERKYVKNETDVDCLQIRKQCTLAEKKLQDEIKEFKAKIDDENRANEEIESFLRTHIQKRQELLQFWGDKYETDVEAKQKELDLLKAAKANDYARIVELTRLYHEYEQVVVDDRVEKEKLRRKMEKEIEETDAALKIQSWWRGIMVRRSLGQFKPKKKKRGKGKGKGKGKKGGKKK